MPVKPPPLILNFDDSAGAAEGAISLDLRAWQEKIRFGCSWRAYHSLCAELEQKLPPEQDYGAYSGYGTALLGSGDYHHLSYFLIKRLGEKLRRQAGSHDAPKFRVVIMDNHPDNMRYPFGIHCGSWVSHIAALPFVEHIDVVGITSHDIAAVHAMENRLLPLLRGKLTYWSVGVNASWARLLRLGSAFHNFTTASAMAAAFLAEQAASAEPLYFSLDKDVLSPSVLRTNWDQGVMETETLLAIIKALQSRMIAADIVGEASACQYKSRFKRLLSRLDGQKEASAEQIAAWQSAGQAFNRRILPLLP